MISSGWRKARIGEIAEVKGGKRLPAGYYLQATPTHRPYIRVADMRVSGVDQSDIKYVPEGAISRIQNYRIYIDDIFISVAGTLGIVGRVPISLDGANLTENADRLTNIKCDVAYLMYALQSNPIQDEIDSIRTVGAQPKLALSRIRSFEILMPSDQAEQSRVSRALSDTDDLIESLERLISKKQAIKQGMMQELLTGNTRLSGFTSKWESKTIGQLCVSIRGGGTPSKAIADYWGGQIPWATVKDLSNFNPKGTLDHISTRGVAESAARVVPAGELIVSVRMLIARAVQFSVDVAINQDLKVLNLKQEVDPTFLRYWFNLNEESFARAAGGSTVSGISTTELATKNVDLPPIEEQAGIAHVLQDADEELNALMRRLQSARNVKDGMMQELLTGRTRLPVEEISS